MAFDKKEIKQLEELFSAERVQVKKLLDDQRSAIMVDTELLLEQKLRPIREELEYIKKRLDALYDMESEDIKASYKDIDRLKKRVSKLELQVAELKH